MSDLSHHPDSGAGINALLSFFFLHPADVSKPSPVPCVVLNLVTLGYNRSEGSPG